MRLREAGGSEKNWELRGLTWKGNLVSCRVSMKKKWKQKKERRIAETELWVLA